MCILVSIPTIYYDYLFAKSCSVGCVYAIISNQSFANPFVRSNIYLFLAMSNDQIESTQLNHDL